MLKSKKMRAIAASIAVMLIVGITAFAKQATETISVMYDNIKILIDGVEYTAQDANGNVIEPFIYNGTTYLPVRGIANAFDKEVDWEPQTSTVVLGSKNYDWLDQLGFVDYKTTGTGNIFAAIPAGTQMSDGMKYDRGLYFEIRDGVGGTIENNDGSLDSYQQLSFLLNGEYKNFTGTLAVLEWGDARVQIKFYGDGNLLYTSPIISKGMKSTNFDVNVNGIKLLKIDVQCISPAINSSWEYRGVTACIADARLSKK